MTKKFSELADKMSPESQARADALYEQLWAGYQAHGFEEDMPSPRRPHPAIAGKGKTQGDLVSPIVDEEDWECLK
ncbi:hypothetical protein [Methylomagnum sp.]